MSLWLRSPIRLKISNCPNFYSATCSFDTINVRRILRSNSWHPYITSNLLLVLSISVDPRDRTLVLSFCLPLALESRWRWVLPDVFYFRQCRPALGTILPSLSKSLKSGHLSMPNPWGEWLENLSLLHMLSWLNQIFGWSSEYFTNLHLLVEITRFTSL